MKHVEEYMQDQYEKAIKKEGLGLAPDDFLDSLDFEVMAFDVFDDPSMSKYVETVENGVAEDYPRLSWDSNRFGELVLGRIEAELTEITEDDIADVRDNIMNTESIRRDPFGHYGVSKKDFYGVNV